MADLMHEHMGHDCAERILAFAPEIEKRPAIEPDHVGQFAGFLDRVNILSEYDTLVHSPSLAMRLPSVVSLKSYVKPTRYPAFTRFNVFLRDRFICQYCGGREDLTFGWGGWAPALPGPGLGVAIDPQALGRIAGRKEVLLG